MINIHNRNFLLFSESNFAIIHMVTHMADMVMNHFLKQNILDIIFYRLY